MSTQIEFTYVDAHEDTRTEITKNIVGDSAIYLPNIIQEFVYFLQNMGFTYISAEIGQDEDGNYVIMKEANVSAALKSGF